MLKIINKINWVIATLIIVTTGPALYFAHIIFIPSIQLVKPSIFISILFCLYIIFISTYYRVKNTSNEKEIDKLINLQFQTKPVFTQFGKNKIKKGSVNRTITFYILPFVGLISSILLYFTFTQTAPGLYTKYMGKPITIASTLLNKKVHASYNNSRPRYSLEFKEFNKTIYVKYNDFIKVNKNENTTMKGKESRYGLLIESFH